MALISTQLILYLCIICDGAKTTYGQIFKFVTGKAMWACSIYVQYLT